MHVGHQYAQKHTHTINANKTCALQQTTDTTGTKHRLCEIDVNTPQKIGGMGRGGLRSSGNFGLQSATNDYL